MCSITTTAIEGRVDVIVDQGTRVVDSIKELGNRKLQD
jgi:hypothetical protein